MDDMNNDGVTDTFDDDSTEEDDEDEVNAALANLGLGNDSRSDTAMDRRFSTQNSVLNHSNELSPVVESDIDMPNVPDTNHDRIAH